MGIKVTCLMEWFRERREDVERRGNLACINDEGKELVEMKKLRINEDGGVKLLKYGIWEGDKIYNI